jgi:hypothetical protein
MMNESIIPMSVMGRRGLSELVVRRVVVASNEARKNKSDRAKRKRLLAKADGKCIRCFKHDAVEDLAICVVCREYQNTRVRVRTTTRKCTSHPDKDVVENKTACQTCIDYKNERRINAKRNGKCVICVNVDAVAGKTACPGCLKRASWSAIKSNYGMTENEYMQMYEEQRGECAICLDFKPPIGSGTKKSDVLVIDHNHISGRVRKLLCQRCNSVFGYLREDPEVIKRLADNMIAYALHFQHLNYL